MNEPVKPPIYQIEIAGEFDPSWIAWLNEFSTAQQPGQPPVTILTGAVVDQPRLRGILNNLWDLNISILAVHRVG